jgi:uncharacterized membrane protein YkvA (DUF1232 family)
MSLLKSLKKIRWIKSEIQTLKRAYMDARTPTSTKLAIAVIIIVYIVSPIDIAPDLMPLVGIIDDVFIIPLIMWIWLPNAVLDDARSYIAGIEKKEPPAHHWIFWTFCVTLLILMIYTLYLLIS